VALKKAVEDSLSTSTFQESSLE